MPDTDVRTDIAHQMWTLFEPYHSVSYFMPETRAAYERIGLHGYWQGYFAGRAAPMGQVGAGVVWATFFGFARRMVDRAVPDVWSRVTPAEALAARLSGADEGLRRVLGPALDGPEIAVAAELAGRAARAAAEPGRPLAAANAELPPPAEPYLALWQATGVLREHRGDGHVAVLTGAGLDGCAAQVLQAAVRGVPREMVQQARGWTDDEWADATHRLAVRGWVDAAGGPTPAGRDYREALERTTNRLAAGPWLALGEDGTARLARLLHPLRTAILASGALPPITPVGLPGR